MMTIEITARVRRLVLPLAVLAVAATLGARESLAEHDATHPAERTERAAAPLPPERPGLPPPAISRPVIPHLPLPHERDPEAVRVVYPVDLRG